MLQRKYKLGEFVLTRSDRIAVVCFSNPRELVVQDFEKRSILYEDLASVTEFTPAQCQQMLALLPKAVYGPTPYTNGRTGSDPEIFAFDEKNAVIPAWEWLPHPKQNKEFYYDGVQGEFTVNPSYCHNYVTDAVQSKLRAVNQALKAKYPIAQLRTADVVTLDRKTLLTADDKFIMLGCAPSQNAYPEVKPIDVGDPREHPYRYSGCHLHQSLGGHPLPAWFPHGTIVMMDKVCGLLLTALGRGMEDPRRRIAYGRAGEFRRPANTDTGAIRLEYRTPGSFLLMHPAVFNFGADIARVAFRMGMLYDGRQFEIPDVQGIINTCDADGAWKVINQYKTFFADVFHNVNSGVGYNSNATFDVLEKGAKDSGRFEGSIENTWNLNGLWQTHNENEKARWNQVVV